MFSELVARQRIAAEVRRRRADVVARPKLPARENAIVDCEAGRQLLSTAIRFLLMKMYLGELISAGSAARSILTLSILAEDFV